MDTISAVKLLVRHGMSCKKRYPYLYEFVLYRFESHFSDRGLASITSDEILSFLNQVTERAKQ